MAIFLGWLVGLFVAVVLVLVIFVAFGVALPTFVGFLAAVLAAVTAFVGTVTPNGALTIAFALIASLYIFAYALATASLSGVLPQVNLPIPPGQQAPAPGVPTPLPDIAGELFARGFCIGLTATFNAALLGLIPVVGIVLAVWIFVVNSLAAFSPLARNAIFQGVLGWSGWLCPMAYLATGLGLLLFIPNAVAILANGTFLTAVRIDWTTGVIESAGGLVEASGYAGGFSLGNFTFMGPPLPQIPFTVATGSSHETGHSLNTAALSSVFLWINAVDQNVPPFRRLRLAYGELTAESHAQGLPGAPRPRFFVRIWS